MFSATYMASLQKEIEQSLIDGAIQGVFTLGIMWVGKQAGIIKPNTNMNTKGLLLVGSVMSSEVAFDYANKKGWLKWSKVQ